MAYSKTDVATHKNVDGTLVELTDAERQAIADSWNAEPGNSYSENRREAYPSIGDQLDMLWHAIEANATLKTRYADFHTAIKAVKDANPKP